MNILSIFTNRFFRNINIYFLASIFSTGLSFLFLPIITRYLKPDDFGICTLFNTLVYFMSLFIGFNFSVGVDRQFFNKQIVLSEYLGNCIFIGTLNAILLFGAVVIFGKAVAGYLSFPLEWIYVSIIVAYFGFWTNIYLTILRLEQKATNYLTYQVLSSVLGYLFMIVGVVILLLGWYGRLSGILFAALLLGSVCGAILFNEKKILLSFNTQYIKDLLIFGVPLLPLSVANFITFSIDKIIISSKIGLSEMGVYSIAFQIASLIPMLVTAIVNAWIVWVYSKMDNLSTHEEIKITKSIYLIFGALLIVSFTLSGVAPFIIEWLTTKDYSGATRYICYLALANVFGGMATIIGFPSMYYRKTWNTSIMICISAAVDIILTYYLTEWSGAIGAAYALLLSNILLILLCVYLNRNLFRYQWRFFYQGEPSNAK